MIGECVVTYLFHFIFRTFCFCFFLFYFCLFFFFFFLFLTAIDLVMCVPVRNIAFSL
jgi:hypothetical protein